ncbi:XRE family transcriptional regulator [Bacillus sp. T33-2]|nr:helix-turn-helix transcriptional regulator [Bacillus sp. T33-2]PLR92673.1 XRE family transcriptional regulator [Bacillus sp. T33-2]
MSAIGQNIKLCRERLNLTQEELAFKMRVGPNTIEKYESGQKVPNTQTILKFSTVLDVPASELMEQAYQPRILQ